MMYSDKISEDKYVNSQDNKEGKQTISKVMVDELITLLKRYWSMPYDRVTANMILNEIWIVAQNHPIRELLQAIFCGRGLKPDATNEDIYAVLKLLGWRVE